MKIAVLVARILLGLIFVVFGFNYFHPFITMAAPPMSDTAKAFSGGLYNSGYFFQYMKVIEIVSGLFLLINRYTALFVLVLAPIVLNIFLFHAILAPFNIALGSVILLLELFLMYAYRKYYASIFTAMPVAD
jgi:putative oxidoreductase